MIVRRLLRATADYLKKGKLVARIFDQVFSYIETQCEWTLVHWLSLQYSLITKLNCRRLPAFFFFFSSKSLA